MISRCPSCGTPAPDEVRQCPVCDWNFVTNKKGEGKPIPQPPPSPAEKKPKTPASDVPAVGLGMASLPKAQPRNSPPPAAADANPFALPVARNLGSKPGESLFAPPPITADPKLPEARPKKIAPPVPEAPLKKEPELKKTEAPKVIASPRAIDPPTTKPGSGAASPAETDDGTAASDFLPSTKTEIEVKAALKRPRPEAAVPEAKTPKTDPAVAKDAAATGAPQPPAGRPSVVYFVGMAGAALGLLGVGVIFMMMHSQPQDAALPSGSSPFGKRASGDATMTPGVDERPPAPSEPPRTSPPAIVPAAETPDAAPEPISIPAPPRGKPVEPPVPGRPAAVPASSAKVSQALVEEPPTAPARATATFAKLALPTPAAEQPSANEKAKPEPPAVIPKKKPGPQWVFEGTIYDLLSTRGVYGVKLVFVDAQDNVVASLETEEDGHYRVSMNAGPSEGYLLRIVHSDYSGKHIDELDSTSSVRKADLEQRKFLMKAGVRSLPWIGVVGKTVRRDMALVPKVTDD